MAGSPARRLASTEVDGETLHVRMDRDHRRLPHALSRRRSQVAKVLLPHVADLMPHMPVKAPPDMSRFLLCPMPGQVVRIDVAEGDIVEDGQTLAIVEAMKMENVLKAEKRARVSKVHAVAGRRAGGGWVILEFEAV